MISMATVGYWVDRTSGKYRGGVKEFDIWSSAATLEALRTELRGLVQAHLAGYRKLLTRVGGRAKLYYSVDKPRWRRVENTEKMGLN